jgi:hypothetical protein
MIKLKNILAENMRRFGTKNLNEQADQDFLNVYLEDFKKQGWTLETSIKSQQTINTLTKNDMQIIFAGGALTGIKVSTKIFPSDMGSDNLQNKDLANTFIAYDNSLQKMQIPNPHEVGNFKYWYATVNYSTVGKTKESTPFYKYYADIIKLSQISDKFTAFRNANPKDQLKAVGGQLKGAIGQAAAKVKQATTQQTAQS